MFLVPPEISGGVPYCCNHSDRFAVGICNDCGENFCSECLHIYNLQTRGAEATLFLCPECLNKRHCKDANSYIYGGLLFSFFGAAYAVVTMSFNVPIGILAGALFLILGIGMATFGFSKRSKLTQELTIHESKVEHEKMRAEFADMEEVDVIELYNELLKKYINHWGLDTGTDLLDKEISAYLRHGADFEEAIRKISQRQQSKHS